MITDGALTTLLACRPPGQGPLLPNLRVLSWLIEEDNNILPQVIPFLSPSLRELYLSSGSYLGEGTPILRTLQMLASRSDVRLSHLLISANLREDPRCPDALGRVLDTQRHVTILDVFKLSVAEPLLMHLQGFQNLRDLVLEVTFPVTSELKMFINGLGSGCPPGVELLDITVENLRRPLAFGAFRPLLRVRGLHTLRLQYYHEKLTIHERDIVDMGTAWRQMQYLAIQSMPTNPVSALAVYARSFSSALLSLTLNITIIFSPSSNEGAPTFPSLKAMDLSGDAEAEVLPELADFLVRLCPDITAIKYGPRHQRPDNPWSQLIELARAKLCSERVALAHLEEPSR